MRNLHCRVNTVAMSVGFASTIGGYPTATKSVLWTERSL